MVIEQRRFFTWSSNRKTENSFSMNNGTTKESIVIYIGRGKRKHGPTFDHKFHFDKTAEISRRISNKKFTNVKTKSNQAKKHENQFTDKPTGTVIHKDAKNTVIDRERSGINTSDGEKTGAVRSKRGNSPYVNKEETRRSVIIHASEINHGDKLGDNQESLEFKETNGLMLLASHAEHLLRAEPNSVQEGNNDIQEKYSQYKRLAEIIIRNKEIDNRNIEIEESKPSSNPFDFDEEFHEENGEDKLRGETQHLKHQEKFDLRAWFPSITNVNLTPSSQISELITQRLLLSSQRLLGSDIAQADELADGQNKNILSKNKEIVQGICPNTISRENKEDPQGQMERKDHLEITLPSLSRFQIANTKEKDLNANGGFNDVTKREASNYEFIETQGKSILKRTQDMMMVQNNINLSNTGDSFLTGIVGNEMNLSNQIFFPFLVAPHMHSSSAPGSNLISSPNLAFLFQPLRPPSLSLPNQANPFNSFVPKTVPNANNVFMKNETTETQLSDNTHKASSGDFTSKSESDLTGNMECEATTAESQTLQQLDYVITRHAFSDSESKSYAKLTRSKKKRVGRPERSESKMFRCEENEIEQINLQQATKQEFKNNSTELSGLFVCEFCFKQFTNKDTMKRHILTHNGNKTHKCLHCARSFYSETSYISHVKTHTGEKAHKCKHCSMSFGKKSALEVHLRTHSGERPYQCTYCGKSFSISGNLHRHLLIHTGLRPYKCGKCSKTFNNPSHLARHISSIHGGRKHIDSVD